MSTYKAHLGIKYSKVTRYNNKPDAIVHAKSLQIVKRKHSYILTKQVKGFTYWDVMLER